MTLIKLFYSIIFVIVVESTSLIAQNKDLIPIDLSYSYIKKKYTLDTKNICQNLVKIKEDSTFSIVCSDLSITGKLFNYQGRLDIIIEDKKLDLLIKGQYANGLDLLKVQNTLYDPLLDTTYIMVNSYYEPLEDGEWHYYSLKKGKRLYSLYFDKGIWLHELYRKQY